MIDGALRLVAVLACLVVAAGFVAFAVDELSGASERQQAAVTGSTTVMPAPGPESGGLRGALDRAGEPLLAPFAGIAPSSNPWVARGVPTLLALALYGLGLGFLARWLRSRA